MNIRALPILMVALSVPLNAEPATGQALRPPIDSPSERQALRKLTMCVARVRPRWARTMLSYPYLSNDQARVAAEMVSGRDNCLGASEVAVAFRTSSVVGFAAEHFVEADIAGLDRSKVGKALNTASPMNVSEDFALCLAARNPAAALDLASTDPGSPGEARAAGEVASAVPSCSRQGEKLELDQQALRALVATALYRAISAASGPAGG